MTEHEKALWSIATGQTATRISHRDRADLYQSIAREALGEKWKDYEHYKRTEQLRSKLQLVKPSPLPANT